MEIERKFRVQALPELTGYPVFHIRQAYISASPTIRIREVITEEETEYVLTIKGHGKIAREEYELGMEKADFERLLTKCEGQILSKERYRIPLDDRITAELDIYGGALTGLKTVEVEFESLDCAMSWTPPSWFGEDISLDPRYKNSYLCMEWANNQDQLI